MKWKSKKKLSLFLSIALLFGSIPISVVAADNGKTIRIVVDGVVHTCPVNVQNGKWFITKSNAEKIFGNSNNLTGGSIDLQQYAKARNISYEQDTVLDAAYFHTYETYSGVERSSFYRAFTEGLVDESWRSRTQQQISSKDYRAMLAKLVQTYAPDKMAFFDQQVSKTENMPMTRGHGFMMAYFAAVCLGADTVNNHFDHTKAHGGDFWDGAKDAERLFPHIYDAKTVHMNYEMYPGDRITFQNYFEAGYLWSVWHSSPLTDEQMFTFDERAGSMHQKKPLTVFDAVCTLTRLYDWVHFTAPQSVSVTDPQAVTPNRNILTDLLIKKANQNPTVTAEHHPKWNGFTFNREYSREIDPNITSHLIISADWGFNSASVKFDYESLFDTEITKVNMENLLLLDEFIATAIQNNMHLNLVATTLPGRTCQNDQDTYTSIGDFDLFINAKKQEKANAVWALLAERYKNIPSDYLSFTPFWEATNHALSTGLSHPNYSSKDVGKYLNSVINVIHAKDSDRLIIYEATANTYDPFTECSDTVKQIQGQSNIMIKYNFADEPFLYYRMPDEQGAHVDFAFQSNFLPEYPAYIYSVRDRVDEKHPLTLDGCLPAGTVLKLYLEKSDNATLKIMADDETLYSEKLKGKTYNTTVPKGRSMAYATSDKYVSVTLPEDANQIMIVCDGGGFDWSGMDVTLPAKYAVERWYNASNYDVFQGREKEEGFFLKKTSTVMISPNNRDGSTKLTIYEDVTYSSEAIFEKSSKETIVDWANKYKAFDGNCVIRIEPTQYGGRDWKNAIAYYTDVLELFGQAGFSWFSNEWEPITDKGEIVGGTPVPYKNFKDFNPEMLKLMQKYQNIIR